MHLEGYAILAVLWNVGVRFFFQNRVPETCKKCMVVGHCSDFLKLRRGSLRVNVLGYVKKLDDEDVCIYTGERCSKLSLNIKRGKYAFMFKLMNNICGRKMDSDDTYGFRD